MSKPRAAAGRLDPITVQSMLTVAKGPALKIQGSNHTQKGVIIIIESKFFLS